MITTIQHNVPRCPKCSALMFQRTQTDAYVKYYVCNDCGAIYEVIDNGQADNELQISDGRED